MKTPRYLYDETLSVDSTKLENGLALNSLSLEISINLHLLALTVSLFCLFNYRGCSRHYIALHNLLGISTGVGHLHKG